MFQKKPYEGVITLEIYPKNSLHLKYTPILLKFEKNSKKK